MPLGGWKGRRRRTRTTGRNPMTWFFFRVSSFVEKWSASGISRSSSYFAFSPFLCLILYSFLSSFPQFLSLQNWVYELVRTLNSKFEVWSPRMYKIHRKSLTIINKLSESILKIHSKLEIIWNVEDVSFKKIYPL